MWISSEADVYKVLKSPLKKWISFLVQYEMENITEYIFDLRMEYFYQIAQSWFKMIETSSHLVIGYART